jgi:Helix-turn-helix domain
MADQAILHDKRRTYHFWVDDALFDVFGPELGPYGIAVYAYLARCAKNGTAFPSLPTIALKTGMARSAVQCAIKRLIGLDLISMTPRKTTFGGHTSNIYTLLPLDHAHCHPIPPGGSTPPPHGSTPLPDGTPLYRQEVDPLPPGGTKGVSLKDTHLKDSHVCVDTNERTHTSHGHPELATPGKTGKGTPFPADDAAQAALKTAILTEALTAWTQHMGLSVMLPREFERWLAHALSRQRITADFAADFKAWLLDPLSQAQRRGALRLPEDRAMAADQATAAFIEEVHNGIG